MNTSMASPARLRTVLLATVTLALSWACAPQDASSPVAESAPPAAAVQPAVATGPTRMESDLLGEKAVPAEAYYGVQTARALENFQISGIPINHYPGFVEAWAIVKLAAARGQHRRRRDEARKRSRPSKKPPTPLMKGQYHDQFKVDWYQGGAGTSTNMNVNEVMANIALELSGHKKGDYKHRRAARPPEHVAVDQRLVSDRDQDGVHPAQRQAHRRTRKPGGVVPRQRRSSSSTS